MEDGIDTLAMVVDEGSAEAINEILEESGWLITYDDIVRGYMEDSEDATIEVTSIIHGGIKVEMAGIEEDLERHDLPCGGVVFAP